MNMAQPCSDGGSPRVRPNLRVGEINHVDLNLLRVFLAVAETASFTAAATELHTTQSTISQRIGRLEQQLNRRLLERTRRSTCLTEDGQVLLRYAQRIEALSSELRAEFSHECLTGEVRLSVPEDFVSAGFADVLARFKRLQPRVKVELRTGFAAEQHAWMEGGEIDLAVIRSVHQRVGTDVLWSERILWVSSRNLAAELAREHQQSIPLIHAPSPCLYREVAMKSLSEHGLHWNSVMTSPHLTGILAGVAAGLGVAPVPECGLPDECVVLGTAHGLPTLPDCHLLLQQRETADSDDAVEALKALMNECCLLTHAASAR